MQNAVLTAFLVVEDELQREPRPAGPFRLGRSCAVAREVTRVAQSSR